MTSKAEDSKWESVRDFKCNHLIIQYNIRKQTQYDELYTEIIFNSDETITIKETFNNILALDKRVTQYARENQLTYEPLPSDSTIFKPFHIIWCKKLDGSRIPLETTDVFLEKINKDVDINQITSIDDFKTLRKLEIKTYTELIDLKYWNRKYIVKFALFPKLIVNKAKKTLKCILQCRQLAFEDKDIQYQWKTQKSKKSKNPFLEAFKTFKDEEENEEEKPEKDDKPEKESPKEEKFVESEGQRPDFITQYHFEKSISRQNPIHPGELMSEFIFFIGNEVYLQPNEYRELCDLMKQYVENGKISKLFLFHKVLTFSKMCIPQVYSDFRNTLSKECILSPGDLTELDRQMHQIRLTK